MTLEDYLLTQKGSIVDGLSKFGYTIISHLSDMYNFTIQCSAATKWEVGDPDGPIVAGLHDEKIDITGSPLSMNVKRTYIIKYVHQSRPLRSSFMFLSPQRCNIKINEILGPFETKVWYLTIFFVVGIFWVVTIIFQYELNNQTFVQFSDSLVLIFAALCQQGSELKINKLSSRVAFLCTFLYFYLLYNYYSASIVSARLNEPIFKLNDSLAELAKLNFKFASKWTVSFDFFIKKDDWETQRFFNIQWVHIPEAERFMEPEQAIPLIQQGKFAYNVLPDTAYDLISHTFTNRQLCELTEVHLIKPTFSTFAVTFNSSFIEIMRIGLAKISETGLRKRQVNRWKMRKPECQKTVLSASSINIYEFAPHLLILLLGIGFASFIFILELAKTNDLK